MRTLTSIGFVLAGIGAIGWSFIGGAARFAGEMDAAAARGEPQTAFAMLIDLITGGAFPQLTAFLYVGVLLIAVGVVTLIVREKRDDR